MLPRVLTRLDLLNKGVYTTSGNTGVIGLSLAGSECAAVYSAGPKLTLHYPLIDRIRGYHPQEKKGDVYFVPFTEKLKATVKGRLPEKLQRGYPLCYPLSNSID